MSRVILMYLYASSARKDLGDVSDFILVEKPSITFEEIGGLDNVKELLKLEVIWPFENPEKYELYGRKPGVGVLLRARMVA